MADLKMSRGLYKGAKSQGKGKKTYEKPKPKRKVYKPKKAK